MQKLTNTNEQVAWAIFIPCDNTGEYLFHSAHWSRSRAKQMLCDDWNKPKIVKIKFVIQMKNSGKRPDGCN